ncbi:MAG: TonB-dependent receptor plug domain-containing protein [Elusimicrobiota bacterium]|jgi:outer membrane cobalamin receptor|nr:TonB-dependent receptor plug domain-containing protein [Elusimicrobiota bacterium]
MIKYIIMKQYAILFIFSLFSLAAFASDINLQIISSSAQIIPEKPWEEYPTLGQALQENSDLQINSYGEGGAEYLTIQGYNKGVQIYLDGAPLPMDITGITDISLIPTAIIERVEIVEGFNPASPQATGSVYIYTKKPIDNATVFDASAYTASNKTNLFSLGMRGSVFDKLPYQLSYSRNTSDGFQINSGYTKDAVNFKVEPFKNQTLSYIYLHSNIGLSGGTTTPIGQWDGEKEKTPVSTTDYMEDTLNQIAFNGQAGKFNYGAAYNNLDRQGENWGEVKIQNQDYFAFAEYALFDFLSLGSSYKHSQIHTNSSY